MNFIEVTDKPSNTKTLINIKHITDITENSIEHHSCVIYLDGSDDVFYVVRESYEEIKMKLLRFAGIG